VTTITAELIPEGSYELRVFGGDSQPGKDPIQTVLVLENLGDETCQVALAHGDLYNAANILIGLKALELGFSTLKFHALKGARVTHWAEKVGEDCDFDYYAVDLKSAAAAYLSGQAT
jgi:hypothetical protein